MTNTIMTDEQAVRLIVEEIICDEAHDDNDIAEAVRQIGNPDAPWSIVKTGETADDYRASGWTDYRELAEGVVTLRRGKRTFANIVDCGDYRLVYIER